MSAEDDIRQLIERSFGTGPRPVPVEALVDELVTRGHRALLRRRLATTAGTLVVLAAAGTAVATAADLGARPPARQHVVASPSPSSSATSSTAPSPSPAATATTASGRRHPSKAEMDRVQNLPLAGYDEQGRLSIAPGGKVVRRIDEPYGSDPGKTVALVVDYDGARYWFVVYWSPDGSSGGTSRWEGFGHTTFDQFVRGQRGLNGVQGSAR
jgi:hypothetical protein